MNCGGGQSLCAGAISAYKKKSASQPRFGDFKPAGRPHQQFSRRVEFYVAQQIAPSFLLFNVKDVKMCRPSRQGLNPAKKLQTVPN